MVHGLVFQHGYYDAQTPQLGQVYHTVFFLYLYHVHLVHLIFVFVFEPVFDFERGAAGWKNPNRKIMALSSKLLGG